MKHKSFLNRIHSAGVEKATKRRRRPTNKLKAMEDVSGLWDALPGGPIEDCVESGEEAWEGLSGSEAGEHESLHAEVTRRRRRLQTRTKSKMQMKTLQPRPGAMRRKRTMEQGEMDRFGRNLAQMIGSAAAEDERGPPDGNAVGASKQAERWVALRRFIGGTMERHGAFGPA